MRHTHFSIGVERFRVVPGNNFGVIVQTHNGKDWVESTDRKANTEVLKQWRRGQ